jgi:mono/diheme cytochrome c family protein
MAPPPLPNLDEILASTYIGRLVAWDPVKQEARWTHQYSRLVFSGTLSSAGMLVFQGDMFGLMHAFDAENGKLLWSAETQNPVMAAPISYAIDGEQYIAVVVGIGGGLTSEGGILTNAWKVRNKSRVLAFKLGGTQQLPAPEPDTRVMPKPLPVTASAEVVDHGKQMYQRQCRYCHGDGLRTGGVNPDLRWSLPATHDNWQAIVIGGMLQPLGMVSFKDYLSPEDAEAIRQYVLSEANREYQQLHAADAPKQ